MLAVDVLAAGNPAYAGIVIRAFVDGYAGARRHGAEFSLAFLPVPIAMSRSVAATFSGTNAATGFLAWLSRHPQLRLTVPELVRASVPTSRHALLFALQHGALRIDPQGHVEACHRLVRAARDPQGAPLEARALTLAHRLGTWCGKAGPASLVFGALGIRP